MTAAFRSTLRFDDNDGFPYVLVLPLVYDSVILDRQITVPAGFPTDLASIPRVVQNLIPKSGQYDRPAVIHDYLYQLAPWGISRGQADAVLNEAMQVIGVGTWTQRLIYAGVRLGGWQPWGKYRDAEVAARA